MAGPWEKYQQAQAASGPAGPWTKYANSKITPPAPKADQYNAQEEADIPYKERFLVKNLAVNPEAGMAYLQKQHPDMQFSVKNNEIFARKPGEQAYKALDPDTGFFSKDFLKDAGDITYDALKGLAIGAATAPAAAAGTLAGGGPLTPVGVASGLAAGSAAGAAVSGGAEALRQKLGEYFGIPNNTSLPDIQKEAAFGALMSPAESAVKAGYQGITRGVIPKIGEMVSGVPKNVLKDTLENYQRISYLSEHPEEFLNLVGKVQSEVQGAVQNKVQQTGQAIGDVISKAEAIGKSVDISALKKALADRIEAATNAYTKNPTAAQSAKLSDLNSIKDEFFMQNVPDASGQIVPTIMPDTVAPSTAFDLKQQLRQIAKPQQAANAASKLNNPADKEILTFGKQGMRTVTEELNKVAPDELPSLNQNYGYLQETLDDTLKNFGTKQQTLNTVKNLDSNAKKVLSQRLNQVLNPDELDSLKDSLQALQTQSYMGNPASLPLSGLGTTSTSRSAPLSALGATIGTLAGYKLGGGYAPAAVGGMIGGSLGGALGSPSVVGAGMRAIGGAEDAMAPAAGALRQGLYGAGTTAWDALQQKYNGGNQ